ncbi:MAG: hypothetical protein ABDI20_08085, partial [Candidatus Bipolaricaulaceae bacterium]
MRMFWLTGLLVLAWTSVAQNVRFSCETDLDTHWKEGKISVSLPLTGIMAKIMERVIKKTTEERADVSPSITLTWSLRDTLVAALHCACPAGGQECCSGPEAEAFARLILYQVLAPPPQRVTQPQPGLTLTTTLVSAERSRKGGANLCRWPGAIRFEVQNYTGSMRIHVGLEWLLKVTITEVTVKSNQHCSCNPDPYCYVHKNHPVLYVPHQFVVPEGEVREFVVEVKDEDGDVRGVGASEGAWVSDFVSYGERALAKVRVPSTLSTVFIMAEDKCGRRVTVERPVIVIHRPRLRVCSEGWWDRDYYVVEWEAFDEDLIRCVVGPFYEYLKVKYALVSSGGGKFFGYPKLVLCGEDRGRTPGVPGCHRAFYEPPERQKPRWVRLFIAVEDAWGLTDQWERTLVNEPPAIWVLPSPPARSAVVVRYGDEVTALVTATDKEGDRVVLQKDFGPGDFPVVERLGAASGTYTWTATTRQPWHVVRFSATEPDVEPPVPSYAYLFIRVLQPPQAYHGQITVPRNSTRTAFLYVEDPDTPPKNLAFTFQTPPGLSVRLVSWARPRYFGIYYGSTMRVEVSVDKSLCDG